LSIASLVTGWLLSPSASTAGPSIDRLYAWVLAILAAVFVAVELSLVYVLVRYRRRPGRSVDPRHGHVKAEAFWTAVTAAILIALGLVSQNLWSSLSSARTLPPPDLVIQVEAEQCLPRPRRPVRHRR
jgi:heme/copper-type cytochrome/quinol oxidase subunit 2